jgi:hypothetical protein
MRNPLILVSLVPLAIVPACGVEESTPPNGSPWSSRPAGTIMAATVVGSAAPDTAGVVGMHTSLVSQPGGRQHATYSDATNGALKYATCSSGCTAAANWQKVTIAGAGSAAVGSNTSLEVDGAGRRHVTYYDLTNGNLKFATCLDQANCTTAANWQKGTVDPAPSGKSSSLAVASDGRRHVSYRAGPALKYATCSTNCTVTSSWARVVVDSSAVFSSIAVGGDGRRHIGYQGKAGGRNVLRYATCLMNCSQAVNWQKLTIDNGGTSGTGAFTSLALDQGGVLHVSYFSSGNDDLRYARCAADCTNSGSWQKVTVDALGSAGQFSSIAVGGNSRVHISHYDGATGDLDYATCAADCLNGLNWTSPHVDGKSANVGRYSSLALGGGLVHISYFDLTNGNLKYLELSP